MKIKLRIKLISCYYNDDNTEQKFKSFNIIKEYDDNIIFKDVMNKLCLKYTINKDKNLYYDIFEINKLFWGQFFSENICNILNYDYSDYEKMKLFDLEKQFSISKLLLKVYLNYDGKGAIIGEKEGIIFYFHTNEKDIHHKPHIHCKYSGVETRIDLEQIKVLNSPFKKSKMKLALKVIKDNQKSLLQYWEKVVVNGENIKFKLEI